MFAAGFDAQGEPQGFLHFAVAPAISALSLSSMPTLRSSSPNGWLVCETVRWVRAQSIGHVSLHFSPFAVILAPGAVLTTAQDLQRRALLRLKGRFQLDDLLAFNRKFFPDWERRFLIDERRLDLPRVGIVALAVESYLPFQATRR